MAFNGSWDAKLRRFVFSVWIVWRKTLTERGKNNDKNLLQLSQPKSMDKTKLIGQLNNMEGLYYYYIFAPTIKTSSIKKTTFNNDSINNNNIIKSSSSTYSVN